jgi:hypothetical protein
MKTASDTQQVPMLPRERKHASVVTILDEIQKPGHPKIAELCEREGISRGWFYKQAGILKAKAQGKAA